LTPIQPRTASKSEHRFLFLDGLRGLAALCVGIFHATLSFRLGFLPRHSVLAVDFFFCLSGFVIAFAYDRKFASGMGVGDFLVYRVIRLYPIIFVSVLFGGALLIGENLWAGSPITQSVLLTLASLFLMPLGLKFGMQAYPPNDPLWSLFFEFVANAVYGVFGRRVGPLLAWTGLLLLAALLVHVVRVAHGVAEIGFSNLKLFSFGYVRVAFPFLAGVLLFRLGGRRQISPLVCGSAVVGILLVMLLNDYPLPEKVLYDLVCVLFVIPALVYVGAMVAVSGRLGALCTWGGAMSYPFYLIHGPTIGLVHSVTSKAHLDYPYTSAAVGLTLAAALSRLVLHRYDIPLRAWLTKRHRQLIAARTLVPRVGSLDSL
jgi:peptidoglycan/LPS O-acetylase OafA/YrhL